MVNFAAAVVLLILLGPLVGVMALALWVRQGPGVVTRCEGVGRHGQRFTLFGFRVTQGNLRLPCIPDSSGLHDLPQIVNVLRGEMNILGPRPVSPELAQTRIARDPRYADRFAVKPGLIETSAFAV